MREYCGNFARLKQTINMSHAKIDRLLQLMQYLSSTTFYTDPEIADKLTISDRTVRRYCRSFREARFGMVTMPGQIHRLVTMDERVPNQQELLRFTPEEASILGRLIGCMTDDNQLKHTLLVKLSAIYDCANLCEVFVKKEMEMTVQRLQEAISEKKQVMLRGYCSANSDARKDYLIEPYKLDVNFVTVIGYDVACSVNKTFKLARIGEVELLDTDWTCHKEHQVPVLDAFRMSGNATHVRLALSWRARNLMIEEYPMSEKSLFYEEGKWFFDGEVRDLKGIGRFVMGLAADVEIVEGEALRQYVATACADAAEKFSKADAASQE